MKPKKEKYREHRDITKFPMELQKYLAKVTIPRREDGSSDIDNQIFPNQLYEHFPDKEYYLSTTRLNQTEIDFLDRLVAHFGTEEVVSFRAIVKYAVTFVDSKGIRANNRTNVAIRLRRIWRTGLIRRFVKGVWQQWLDENSHDESAPKRGRFYGVHYQFQPSSLFFEIQDNITYKKNTHLIPIDEGDE